MPNFEYENKHYDEGYVAVCGCDEAGRGPLCGPVVAAAVILPRDVEIEGLNDSKKLTEKKREQLFDESFYAVSINDCAFQNGTSKLDCAVTGVVQAQRIHTYGNDFLSVRATKGNYRWDFVKKAVLFESRCDILRTKVKNQLIIFHCCFPLLCIDCIVATIVLTIA